MMSIAGCTVGRFAYALFGLMSVTLAAAARAAPVYLSCPTTEGGANDFILDKDRQTITIVLAGSPQEPALQYSETDTEYQAVMRSEGKLVYQFRLNKFTLELWQYNLIGAAYGEPTTRARCAIVERKL